MTSDLKSPHPVLVSELFPDILDRLLKLLRGLEDEQWHLPTACQGWSVKDVGLHLLGGDMGNLSSRRDGHAASPQISGWDELVQFINEWNQDWIRVASRISPPLLIDLLEFTGAQMCDYFQTLDPFAIGGKVSWFSDEPAPVWLDLAREYTERWHHQQHIRDAVNRSGLKEPEYIAPVLATFVRALPRTYRHIKAVEGTIVSLEITGPSGGKWTIRQEKGSWVLYEGMPEHPEAHILIGEDDAWRLFTKGLSSDQAQEQVMIRGNMELGKPILAMVAIIA